MKALAGSINRTDISAILLLLLLASATLVACGDEKLAPPEATPTLTAPTETEATPASSTRSPSIPDLSQFDPEPVPLDPSSEPCEPNRQYVVLRIGGGDLLGACATWDDTWTDELGFVMRVELFGAHVETVHYLLPPGAEGMVVAEDYRPSCDRSAFRFTLFVLLPTGPRFVDAGGRQGICDGG